MNAIESGIVLVTQAGLPLRARPYKEIALALGVQESEVIALLKAMLSDGRVRRIGAVPNHYALGYVANAMTVWDVADEAVEALGRRVGALAFVSHCYRRPRRLPEWPYNLFAMVHGRSRPETERRAREIRALLGSRQNGHDILYSVRILKKTGLRLA